MVSQVREGLSQRAVARAFRVSLNTVQRWVARAKDLPLDEVDWNAQPAGCRASSRRTRPSVEQRVLVVRRQLRTKSDLGEYGPEAIQRVMQERQEPVIPSLATIARILSRRGALDGRKRVRRAAPPPGWFLKDVASQRAELDSFDAIEDLNMRGGIPVNVLTGISLHGGLCAAWPAAQVTAKFTVECVLQHWRQHGLPRYAKFDNGMVFQGTHYAPDTFGRVTRTCLSLDVIPIFAPPMCRGFQADIEAFNRRWQDAVWVRFRFPDRDALIAQSDRFVAAHRRRYAVRIGDAPTRKPFPDTWKQNLQQPLQGTVVFVREPNAKGQAEVLGHTFEVSPVWLHRLVRADVDLTEGKIHFYALRRREPSNHHHLITHSYTTPKKRFRE